MDTDVLKAIPDCKPCQWWYEVIGKCRKPSNVNCPKGIRQVQQEVAETEYTTLG